MPDDHSLQHAVTVSMANKCTISIPNQRRHVYSMSDKRCERLMRKEVENFIEQQMSKVVQPDAKRCMCIQPRQYYMPSTFGMVNHDIA